MKASEFIKMTGRCTECPDASVGNTYALVGEEHDQQVRALLSGNLRRCVFKKITEVVPVTSCEINMTREIVSEDIQMDMSIEELQSLL